VLSSTFEKSILSDDTKQVAVLKVETNLWGFRYIESGMVLQDADIKMWLANCYSYYRTIWFDTFKASGVPNFAVEGVIVNTSKPVLKMAVQKQNTIEYPEQVNMGELGQMVRRESYERSSRRHRSNRKKNWWEV